MTWQVLDAVSGHRLLQDGKLGVHVEQLVAEDALEFLLIRLVEGSERIFDVLARLGDLLRIEARLLELAVLLGESRRPVLVRVDEAAGSRDGLRVLLEVVEQVRSDLLHHGELFAQLAVADGPARRIDARVVAHGLLPTRLDELCLVL